MDCYTEKIGVVYETINIDNWSRALALTSVKLLKAAQPQLLQEWGLDYFPLGIFCDFEKLHHLVTKKRLSDARLGSIITKLKCDRAGLKSDWDRAEYDFYRAIKSFNLKDLRQVLGFMKSLPGNKNSVFPKQAYRYHELKTCREIFLVLYTANNKL